MKIKKSYTIFGIIFAFVIIILIASSTTKDYNPINPTTATPNKEVAEIKDKDNETKVDEKAVDDENYEDASTNISSNLAKGVDEDFWRIIGESETLTRALQSEIKSYSSSIYTLAKTTASKQSENVEYLKNIELSEGKDEVYARACKNYVANGEAFANNIAKYIKTGKESFLDKSEKAIKSYDKLTDKVVNARKHYLLDSGVSEKEIIRILKGK